MNELRSIPLLTVLASFGYSEWKSRKEGREHYGRCVLHEAQKNNTSFSFDDTGRFHCFSCNKKGRGAIDLVMALEGCNYQQAVEYLKGLGDVRVAVRETIKESEVSENPIFKSTYHKYFVESEWLKARGLQQATLDYYGVGEYNNPARRSAYTGKILIPMRRVSDGEFVGYLARATQPNQDPKYLLPKGIQKTLEVFGAWEILQRLPPQGRLKQAFLVESPFAVLKFHQLGFPACSPYGWSVSHQQVEILSRLSKGWVYLPDANKRDNIPAVCGILSSMCWVKCPPFSADDPEHLSREALEGLLR